MSITMANVVSQTMLTRFRVTFTKLSILMLGWKRKSTTNSCRILFFPNSGSLFGKILWRHFGQNKMFSLNQTWHAISHSSHPLMNSMFSNRKFGENLHGKHPLKKANGWRSQVMFALLSCRCLLCVGFGGHHLFGFSHWCGRSWQVRIAAKLLLRRVCMKVETRQLWRCLRVFSSFSWKMKCRMRILALQFASWARSVVL